MDKLTIDPALTRKILVGFLRDEITKFGFRRGVLGLSGGIDSTVSAFLAAEALGPTSVTGLILPYKQSSPLSREHAELVARQIGIRTEVIDITPQIDAYFDRFPEADRMRRANKMARERMTILYDHSHSHEALVVGTSNKTEALLGYTTLWGDMACAINPLGDLYKTQVRQLARYIGVPTVIIEKPPSADLWAGQTDEGELGFTYESVDRLLVRLVDERKRPAELEREGFDARFISRVMGMIRQAQYKRRMPPIAKVSPRSIDRDFRYPRDWGR